MSLPYSVPAKQHRTEITVLKSRFLTTINCATTVEEARKFISLIRSEMPDANHHIYAFRIGYGNTVVEGMSDNGEPTGTAGPPTLSVVRGSNLGDVILVTTRYFGGTKLGKGGLVRAYTESAQEALITLTTEIKSHKETVGIDTPYHLYESVKRLIAEYNGNIQEEIFAGDITLIIELLARDIEEFNDKLRERTSGQLAIVILS